MSCLVSFLVGVGVGVAYALLSVKSPAPPIVALFGLLGMVAGEQGVPWIKQRLFERPAAVARLDAPARAAALP